MLEDQLPGCGAAVEPTADDADDLAWLGGSEGSPTEAALACTLPTED